MDDYALLILPAGNRVYGQAAAALTAVELEVFDKSALGGRLTGTAVTEIGGVSYVTFQADGLAQHHLALLANASAAYALFHREGDLLRPVPLAPRAYLDDDLMTIQKYHGKTNELFTKLLLNVTVLSGPAGTLDARLRVLDPLCGRGTTLNQAMIYGYDAAGLDLDGKDFDAYAAFIRTYLQRKRIKHQARLEPVRLDRRVVGKRLRVSLTAPDGPELTLDVVNADTVRAGEFFKPASFDAVVADLPYGVAHGSRSAAEGLRRDPLALLREAAPVWARLLRPGAAAGIACNTHVASRDAVAQALVDAGLVVLDEGPYTRFRHRVDQAITRDIVVARRP